MEKRYFIRKDIESFGFIRQGENSRIHFKKYYEVYGDAFNVYEFEKGVTVYLIEGITERIHISAYRKDIDKTWDLFRGRVKNKIKLKTLLTEYLSILDIV